MNSLQKTKDKGCFASTDIPYSDLEHQHSGSSPFLPLTDATGLIVVVMGAKRLECRVYKRVTTFSEEADYAGLLRVVNGI